MTKWTQQGKNYVFQLDNGQSVITFHSSGDQTDQFHVLFNANPLLSNLLEKWYVLPQVAGQLPTAPPITQFE